MEFLNYANQIHYLWDPEDFVTVDNNDTQFTVLKFLSRIDTSYSILVIKKNTS